jgi:restriction system protein
VRDLYGTMLNEGASKGILVATSSYGPDAYEFAKDKPLELIDGVVCSIYSIKLACLRSL